jgi:citrate synthase
MLQEMICHAWCSPNVDFYSGIVLRAMGIPISMYTVLFAVARTVGWVSQVCSAICIHPCARVVWCIWITFAPRL